MADRSTPASEIPSDASPPQTASSNPAKPSESTHTSTTSTDTEDTAATSSRLRPSLGSRHPSGTMIVPADHPEIELKNEVYGPNDARSFSPRRSAQDTQNMVGGKRTLLKSHADELQKGLNAIVEKVENVKGDHDKLERNNTALQDYIGGLTQSMSKTNLAGGGSSGGRTDLQNSQVQQSKPSERQQTIKEASEESDDDEEDQRKVRKLESRRYATFATSWSR